MFESILVILCIIVIYSPSPTYFVSTVVPLVWYIYNYWLSFNVSESTSALILFLNKLNSSTVNPLLLSIGILWVTTLYYHSFRVIRGGLVWGAVLLLLLLCSSSPNENLPALNLVYVKIAPTLTNGILIIHPLMLYAFYGLLIYAYLLSSTVVSKTTIGSYPLATYARNPYKTPIYASGVLALGLGSWWSYQELNWGGFWSWDLVEIFLLVSVLYVLLKQHSQLEACKSNWLALFFFVNFFLYIFSVRYNLINSIHNFISQTEFSYKITYLLYLWLSIVSVIIWMGSRSHTFYNKPSAYCYPLMLLGGLYVTLIIYVLCSYLWFYMFNSSSSTLITVAPLMFNTLWLALLLPLCSYSGLILPIVESLFFHVFWAWTFGKGFIWWFHLAVFVSLGTLIVWYGVILLAPVQSPYTLLASIAATASGRVERSWLQWSPLEVSTSGTNLNLYLDITNNSSLGDNAYSLVVYATTYFLSGANYVLFSHKYFCKVSFVEVQLILLILITFLYYYSFFKTNKLDF